MKKTFLIFLVLLCVASMAVSSVAATSDDMISDDIITVDDNAIEEVSLETDDSISDSVQADVDDSDDKSLGSAPLKEGASTIYVSTTGDDTNDGLSEENSVATIAKAYELAGDGSTINVAAGTYDQSSSITLDKSITFNGADGAIINRAGTASVFMYSGDDALTFTLNNLIFTAPTKQNNPIINIGGAGDLKLNNCKLTDAVPGNGNGAIKLYYNAKATLDGCEFYGLNGTSSSAAPYLAIQGNSIVEVKNSIFHDINIADDSFLRAIIYVNSASANGTVSNCRFYNNSGNMMGIIENKQGYLNVSNSSFEDNTLNGSLSKGIIYVSQTTAVGNTIITGNSFHDNDANYTIWISAAPTTVEYNAFDLAQGQYAIGNNKQAAVTVNCNFFGTNDNPSALLDNVTAPNWVIMSASASADSVAVGEDITITADFSKYTDGTNTGDVEGTMAEVPVKFTNSDDTKGSISDITYENNKAIVTYTGIAEGDDSVAVSAASVSTNIPITVIGSSGPSGNVIYVKPDGSDENDGLSEATAVKTIAKAVELASAGSGQILIKEGTYNENNITINSEIPISIVGEDGVVIDGTDLGSNSIFFIKTTNAVTIENIKFTNNKAKYGAINIAGTSSALLDADVTINNCIFDKLEGASSSRGGAIYTNYLKGKLVINNSVFTNCNATGWGGALGICYSAYEDGLDLIINNTSFENNSANNGGAGYLMANTITIENSNFTNNRAIYSPGALYFYNCTASMNNCIVADNQAKNTAAAIAVETVSNQPTAVLTITNSIIENNTGVDAQAAAINVNKATLEVSYSSLVNDLSINTITATGYGAVYGQGMAIVNYNWWGTNDPSAKVNGTNITMDNWVIMNVEPASAENIEIGGTVLITVDFNHYTDGTTVSELTDKIPELKVTAAATSGTLDKAEAITENGQASFIYTAVAGGEDTVNIASSEAIVPIAIVVNTPIPPHDVYVSKDGNDENNGEEASPVATIAKAIEIASSDAGTGNIFINAGTYTETGFTIAKDMVITGVGDVTIDANNETGKMFTIAEGVSSFALNNVAITKANQNYGAVLYNYYTADVVLDNVTITESYANGWSGSGLIVNKGKLTIKDSKISNNGPISALIYNDGGTLIINNTAFENNVVNVTTSCNGAIESTGKTFVTIENCNFTNIGSIRGAVYSGASDEGSLTIVNTRFENCSALLDGNNFGYGGAVHSQVPLTIDKSVFLNSKSYKDGAAVYATKAATITNSVFMGGDSQDGDTAEIYASGDLTLNNNILVKSSDDKYLVKTGSGTVDAKNNWWGTNDPSALVSGFALENWVIMNVEPTSTEGAIGEPVEINIDFKHTKNAEGVIGDLTGGLPQELTVYAEAANGTISGSPISTVDLAGKVIFTPEFSGENIVNVYTDLSNKIPVAVIVAEPYTGVIYVSKDGNDNNNGAEDAPVATIAKAVELASAGSGQIVIKEGTYNENNITINSTRAMSIVGEGNVVIDGTGLGSNCIFTVVSSVVSFENIAFTNNNGGRYGSAIKASGTSISNLLLINIFINNCKFDNLESSSRGGAIFTEYTKGTLYINNSVFTNNKAGSWGGALAITYSAYENGLNLKINNSKFANNTANNGGVGYLMADRITIENSNFTDNSAANYPGALELYNCTATIDNCIFTGNNGSKQSAAIKVEGVKGQPTTTASITNSVIENNVGVNDKIAAIYVYIATVEISYSSIVNDHNIETATSSGYDGVYGQGVVVANNNWWGTNDPSTKVNGTNITMDKWVIMNVDANASDVLPGDEVKLTVDFNHVMTSAGEIEELTGGVIPKDSYTVAFVAENGTVAPETITIPNGESGEAVFTASDANAKVTASCGEATKDIIFEGEIPEPYTGIVYVSPDGSDRNNGSEEAPVASIAKAIQIATAETGSGQIVIKEGTYKGANYLITKDLTITGEGAVVIDGEGQGRIFSMENGVEINKFSLSNVVLTGANSGYGAAVYSFAKETVLDNVTIINNPGAGDLITTYGNLTIKDSEISGHNGGDVIQTSGDATIIINNTLFKDNDVTASTSDYGIVYVSSGKANVIIEDSKFINNKARQGVVIGSNDANITVKGSEFINNTNTVSYGGAIRASNKLIVSESVFINNKAYRDGGAIYVGFRGDATITKSEFINNSAGTLYHGDAIYNGNKATVNYCILLTNATNYLIFNDGDDNVVNAQYNWWGTNDNPKSLNGRGTYEDDYGYDEIDCAEVDSSNWIIMNVVADTSDAKVGSEIPITVDFNHYLDSTTSEIKELNDKLAQELTVDFSTQTGSLDKTSVETADLIAQATYTAVEGQNNINVKSSNAQISIEFNAIRMIPTDLSVAEEIEVTVGEGSMEITLTGEGSPVEGKVIIVKVNDEINLTGTTNAQGIATIDLSSVPVGTYNAEIAFEGDSPYEASTAATKIVVNEAPLSSEDLQKLIDETPAGGTLNLSNMEFVNVSDINITKDIAIVGDNLTINTAGDKKPVFNIASDVGNVSISGVDFVANNGDVLIKAVATNATDGSIVNPAIEIANNTVTKANDDVVAESITLFELESERGVLATSNPITIADNTVPDGVELFDFEVTGLDSGNDVIIPTGGNVPEKTETKFVLANMTTFAYQSAIDGDIGDYFVTTLTDINGNPLANKTVKVGLNGKVYTRKTNATGGISVLMKTAVSGRYTFAVSFLGDDEYNASFAVALCTVNKQTPKLITSSKTYKASVKTKKLTATFKTKAGKALKGKTIKFTVNGKTYTAKTNAKGVATVKVSITKKGTYKFTAKYAGDSTYAAISKKATLKIT